MPGSGIIVPDMGIRVSDTAPPAPQRSGLADALFTATQQRVLGCLFAVGGRSYAVNELIQATGAGSGAVQRELARLSAAGLVRVERVGNQKRYSAAPDNPIHDELSAIVRKTFGLAGPLREALAPLANAIDAAFIYGSVARGSDTARSDIDLMLVSDHVGYAEAMTAQDPLIQRLGREINPTLYSRDELQARIRAGNSFITRVLALPRIWLIGSDDDLGA